MNLSELEKLAKAATPGPWYHCQPFERVEKQRTIHGTVPAQRVDFVSTCKEPVHKEIVLPMEGRESYIKSDNMAFIAAANPQTILAMIELLREMGEALERIGDTACGEASHQFIALQALAKYKEMTK